MLVTLLVLLVAARLAVPHLGASVAVGPLERDGMRRLADCPDSPNCQGSDSSRARQRVEPFPMHGSAEETIAALATLLERQKRGEIVVRTPDYLHATFTSALMGFVDDVEFLADEASGTVRVRSASRLGKSDLGANAKRLAALREAWVAAIPRAATT